MDDPLMRCPIFAEGGGDGVNGQGDETSVFRKESWVKKIECPSGLFSEGDTSCSNASFITNEKYYGIVFIYPVDFPPSNSKCNRKS